MRKTLVLLFIALTAHIFVPPESGGGGHALAAAPMESDRHEQAGTSGNPNNPAKSRKKRSRSASAQSNNRAQSKKQNNARPTPAETGGTEGLQTLAAPEPRTRGTTAASAHRGKGVPATRIVLPLGNGKAGGTPTASTSAAAPMTASAALPTPAMSRTTYQNPEPSYDTSMTEGTAVFLDGPASRIDAGHWPEPAQPEETQAFARPRTNRPATIKPYMRTSVNIPMKSRPDPANRQPGESVTHSYPSDLQTCEPDALPGPKYSTTATQTAVSLTEAEMAAEALATADLLERTGAAPSIGGGFGTMPGPGASFDPERWLKRPVSFDVKEYSLNRLLREFASLQGVSCDISEKLSGSISGLSAFKDPKLFLDLLCRAQSMNWYYDGATVYFFPDSDMKSRMFVMKGINESRLLQTMSELGFFDPRFSWRMTEDKSILMVQGPEAYLRNIEDLMERKSQLLSDKEQVKRLGVFRLKHAWAAERTFSTGDNQIRVPGVADMLQQIISGGSLQAYRPESSLSYDTSKPRLMKGVMAQERENRYLDGYERYPERRPGRSGDGESAGAVQRGGGDSGGDRKDDAPFIQSDQRLNAILVWDFERNMELHASIIKQLDQPLSLVEIRAAIVDVDVTRTRELGVSTEYLRDAGGKWEGDVGSNVGTAIAKELERIKGDGLQFSTIYKNGLDLFMAKVSAIAEDGYANVLSRPSVLTQDNIEATLQHTETFYVKLEGERQVDLADVKTGLTLRVTPHVIEDENGFNSIQMAVHIIDGTTTSESDLGENQLPRVRESAISTQAVVNEGEALIIGGYYNELHNNTVSGVPGLSKIPGLGALFRTKSKRISKSERLFVLSPRIVFAGEAGIETGSEMERSFNYSPAKCLIDGPKVLDKKAREDQKNWSTR